jgi:hypothetical protein
MCKWSGCISNASTPTPFAQRFTRLVLSAFSRGHHGVWSQSNWLHALTSVMKYPRRIRALRCRRVFVTNRLLLGFNQSPIH